MTPDKLRALADALSRQRQADEHGIYCAVPRQAVDAAIRHLRAQADVQPVRAVPIGHALSAVRHVGSANYPDRERAAIERLYSAEFDAYAHPAPAASQGEPKRNQPLLDLLAVIHCDGGHHTEAVGIDQSIKDAQAAVCELKRELAMGKREPLSLQHIHKLEEQADQQWRDNEYLAEWSIVFARLIERAHGIGGSDE